MIEKVASSAYDRTERPGVAWLVLLLAAALVGVMAVYFLAPASAPRVTMAALAVFAVAGVFSLFAYAVGLLQFTSRAARNDVTKLISDTGGEGLLATEGELQILYANEAYMELCGARGRERHHAGRAAVLRAARSLRGHLPTGASGARRTASCRGYALVAALDGTARPPPGIA